MKTSRPSTQPFLYQRLSAFYFFFFAVLGAFIPYWPPYLKSLHFSAVEIGELMAIVMASKIVAPYLLGWLSDYIQRRLLIIQLSLVITVIAFFGVFTYQSYWWFVAIMTIFGFFWNASLPLFEALTMDHLDGRMSGYSYIRLWGSVGFIISVAALPLVIGNKGIIFLPYIVMALLIANGLSSIFVKDKINNITSKETTKITDILKKPMVIALLLSCSLQSLSHGTYYTFFSIYLEDHGYSRDTVGLMWALGVLAEVVLFIIVMKKHHIFNYLGVYRLFSFALFITSLRWLVLAFLVDNSIALILSQLLHAASFGLFHLTAISIFHQLFPGRLQGRGQALYAGISFGLGGALGTLLSGHTWDSMGPIWTFLASACIAFLGAIIAAIFVKKEHLPIYAKEQ